MGKGKRGEKAEPDDADEVDACPWMWMGEVEAAGTSFSRLGWREGPREGARDDVCEAGRECRAEVGDADPDTDAGEGARVAVGVLGTLELSPNPGAPAPPKPAPGKPNASAERADVLPVCRNSMALRTDSGTFCSLIDSAGGGAAGKGADDGEAS